PQNGEGDRAAQPRGGGADDESAGSNAAGLPDEGGRASPSTGFAGPPPHTGEEFVAEARSTFSVSSEDVEGPNTSAVESPGADASSARTGVAAALEEAHERQVLATNAPEGRITFSEKFACPVSGFTIAEIEPRLFSFNAPQGACPACDGLGEKLLFDPDLIVPNENLSIKKGAVVPWAKSN